MFNGKSVAEELAAKNQELWSAIDQLESAHSRNEQARVHAEAETFKMKSLVDQYGLLDVQQKIHLLANLERESQQRIADEHAQAAIKHAAEQAAAAETLDRIKTETNIATSRLNELGALIRERSLEATALDEQIVDLRETVELQAYGLYDYDHPAEHSTDLKARLDAVRADIKRAVRTKTAATAVQNFTFNNSAAQGRKLVNDLTRLLLRAYNAEAENCVKSVRAGNLQTALTRLQRSAEQVAKNGKMIGLRITDSYENLRLEELRLANQFLQAKAREKEEERERRAELREQKRVEEELRRAQEKLTKERDHYQNALDRLLANGDDEGAQRLRDELEKVQKAIDDVEYRKAHTRAGYVYVISNIGAFGEGVVKIGLTRRLEPMDRVRELGDASVPFKFDVHALFFSQDAVSIETALHHRFAAQRLNQVNMRKEFFRVTPEQVLDALKEDNIEVLEYQLQAEADEYRASVRSLAHV